MKVLIIGLGSMGKRRIRNLRALKINNIYGYDVNPITLEKATQSLGIKIIKNLDNLFIHKFDFVIISTPPQHHQEFVKLCVHYRLPFFVELNLITKDTENIWRLVSGKNITAIPSNTLIYDPDVQKLKKIIGPKFKGYFVFQLGQNIHDWHPWQKPNEHFIFRSDTNGIRELLRVNLPWLIYLFGRVARVRATDQSFFTNRFKIKDFSCVELQFVNGNRGIVISDLITPSVIKKMTIVSNKKSIIWDERNNLIEIGMRENKKKILSLKKKNMIKNYKFPEDAHLMEMKHALNIINKQEKLKFNFKDEVQLLELIDKIEGII